MRILMVAAAAFTVGSIVASNVASAQSVFNAGGPIRQGNMCQITVDPGENGAFGYWTPCPSEPAAPVKRATKRRPS